MPAPLSMEEKIAKIDAKKAAQKASPRTKRSSFNGTEGKLRVDFSKLTEAGYHGHIINDTPGRIQQALATGYEFVMANEVDDIATNVVSRNTDIGDKVRYSVGVGENNEPTYAYLMKIRQELYDEDQAALQAKNDAVDDAIRGGNLQTPGHSNDHRYVPREGIKLSRG